AALLDFEAAEGHANATGAVGEGVGFAAGVARVRGLLSSQFDDAAVPEGGMLPFGSGKVAKDLGADGIGVAVGEGFVGVVALHLGLPVGFESGQNFFQFGAAESGGGHGASPWVLLRIR